VTHDIDAPLFQSLRHGSGFLFSSGAAFPGAIVAPDDKHLFARPDMTDYFFYGFLNGCVHDVTSGY
jgi:hypothetical protein